MSDVMELLERVKAATGPDKVLDTAIWEWTGVELSDAVQIEGARTRVRETVEGLTTTRFYATAPTYTASVDAALALVERKLPGWEWTVSTDRSKTRFWSDMHRVVAKGELETVWGGRAPTAPLAILAALLSALTSGASS